MANVKAGRPRSEKAREAILSATQELLREQDGGGLTIEAIARRAGVGKPTIYRWWPSLADIVLDVLRCQAHAEIVVPDYESLQETLGLFLRRSTQAINDGAGVQLRFLMAYAQQNVQFRERFREIFNKERRSVLRSILLIAAEQGDIDTNQDLDLLVDIIFGAMWYRLLIGHAAIDEQFADDLTAAIQKMAQPALDGDAAQ